MAYPAHLDTPIPPSSAIRRRSPMARLVAVLALIACGFAMYLLVTSFTDTQSAAPELRDRSAQAQQKAKDIPATYTVVAGDSLGVIAEKTGVGLAKLQRLNPDIDAEALNAGQVLNLR